VCYVSLALPVVAEAPVIIAEVVIVAIAVFVEVYIVYDKDWPVEEVVFFNRVAEDTSGAPDARREVRTTQLLERCRPLSYPDNFTEAIIEVIFLSVNQIRAPTNYISVAAATLCPKTLYCSNTAEHSRRCLGCKGICYPLTEGSELSHSHMSQPLYALLVIATIQKAYINLSEPLL
jgi:hypothetical protein